MVESQISPAHDDLASRLCLSLIPGIGPKLQQALINRFGSAAGVLDAPPSELRRVQGIGGKLSSVIARGRAEIDIEAEARPLPRTPRGGAYARPVVLPPATA